MVTPGLKGYGASRTPWRTRALLEIRSHSSVGGASGEPKLSTATFIDPLSSSCGAQLCSEGVCTTEDEAGG